MELGSELQELITNFERTLVAVEAVAKQFSILGASLLTTYFLWRDKLRQWVKAAKEIVERRSKGE
ncbi:MAG: hypothetical protein AAFR42_08830 [Cyanobacteria bacterium J06628_6]